MQEERDTPRTAWASIALTEYFLQNVVIYALQAFPQQEGKLGIGSSSVATFPSRLYPRLGDRYGITYIP